MTPTQQKFEELFNIRVEYDPLSPNVSALDIPQPRLDLTDKIDPTAPVASLESNFDSAFEGLSPPAANEDVGTMTALGRSLKAGVYDLGALTAGALEYPARQTALTHESETVRRAADSALAWLSARRRGATQAANDLMSSLSPQQQREIQSHFFTLDPNQTIFRDGAASAARAVGLKLARMAPPSLTVLVPGGILMRAATMPIALTYIGATEAGLSLGGIQNTIAQDIEQMPEAQLIAQSPVYAQMRQTGMPPAAARQRLIMEAQGWAPVIGGLASAATAAVAGRYLAPVFESKVGANIISRFGRGYAAEAPQEGSQGAIEQVAQNIAARAYDSDREATAGALQQGLEEGMLGGIFGGATAAALGRGPQQPAGPTPPGVPPPAGPTPPGVPPPATSSFEGVFGQGGENPFIPPDEPPPPDGTPRATASQQELEAAGQIPIYLPEPDAPQQEILPLGVPQPLRSVDRQAVVPYQPPIQQGQAELDFAAVFNTPFEGPPVLGGERASRATKVDLGTGQPERVRRSLAPNRIRTGPRQRGGFMPDIPSAEPQADIEAQVIEMLEPDSTRLGVYLSADNVANFGGVESIPGVVMENFDGAGGTLVARDEDVAKQLADMVDSGMPIQQVLGYATGAGMGKPADGDTAVQRRDEAGNVLQESLVPAREADMLVERWRSEYPNDEVVVLSPDEVIDRREDRISEEAQARTGDLFTGYVPQVKPRSVKLKARAQRQAADRVAPKVEQALSDENLGMEAPVATSETKAAARIIGEGARTAARERERRVGGFYPTNAMEFADQDQRSRYDQAFKELVDAELIMENIERQYEESERSSDVIDAYKEATEKRKELLTQLARIRTVARPRRKSERYMRAAEKVAPGISSSLRKERTGKVAVGREDTGFESNEDVEKLGELQPEEIDTLEGQELDDTFYRAARAYYGKNTGTRLTYAAGGTKKGAAPDADEAMPEFLGDKDTIPAGAEPISVAIRAKVKQSFQKGELTLEKTGAKRWKYTVKVPGSADATGFLTGSREEAEARANEIMERRERKQAKYTRDESERGASFEAVIEAHKTPGMKRRLIKRVSAQIRRRAHGGKVKAPGITHTAVQVLTSSGEELRAEAGVKATTQRPGETDMEFQARKREGAFFDTSVLTRDTTKQDESVSDRLAREERASKSRAALRKQLDKADRQIVKLSEDKYAELMEETDEQTGTPTKSALDMRYGRMYFRQVMDFGKALLNSDINSAAALKQMERVTEFMEESLSLRPDAFAARMASIARADLRESILNKPTKGDVGLTKLKQDLANPAKRASTLAKWNDRLRQALTAVIRRNEIWRKNDTYNSVVGPLMMKFADSTYRDGYPSYRATKTELEGLQWALNLWNKDKPIVRQGRVSGMFREQMYLPIRRFFTELGYEFDKNGSLVIPEKETELLPFLPAVRKQTEETTTPAPSAMKRKYQLRHGKDKDVEEATAGGVSTQVPVVELEYGPRKDDGSPREVIETVKLHTARAGQLPERSVSTIYKDYQRALERIRFAKNQSERNEIVKEESVWHTVNRVIGEFRNRIANPKLTVKGMVRLEQRLIYTLKQLGVWKGSPSPVIGKIDLGKGVEKNVNIAGPRLDKRQLSKEKARAMMLKLLPFKLPEIGEGLPAREKQQVEQLVKLAAERPLKYFMEVIDPKKHGDAFLNASSLLHETLNAGKSNGFTILDQILSTVPAGHLYHDVATRMRQLSPANIPVSWTRAGAYNASLSSLGHFRTDKAGGQILLNKQAFEDLAAKNGEEFASAAILHTVLHELAHATTMYALESDHGVRQSFKHMKTMAARHFRNNGLAMPYGLKDDQPIQEFVAEAFTNSAFQDQLMQIKYEKGTVWSTLLSYIRQLLGLRFEHTPDTNLMDAVMATADRVFTDTPFKSDRESIFDMSEETDPVAKTYIAMGDNFYERGKFIRASASNIGLRAPLSMMTLSQIRNEFKDRLAGLDEYYRAFKRRDSRNSELLEEAERLSREWTKLTEQDKAKALEFSWMTTNATVHDVHPDVPLDHKRNEHVTEEGQKKAHAQLRASFQSLPAGWQELYGRLQKYYNNVLNRESILLAQNALRATLTKGINPLMTRQEFDAKFSVEKIAQLGTKAKLAEALDGLLADEMVTTISAMRTLPQRRTGPYFPLMRYGNYVVSASRKRESKHFDDKKEASAWRATQLADDPTLEVIVREDADGGYTATVTERSFILSENPTEAQIKRYELVEEYGEENVSAVTKKVRRSEEATIQSNEALGRILTNLSDNLGAQSAIRQYYLRTVSDRSFRKHEIKRKLRRGYDSKLQHRNFTSYAQAASYYTAQLEHGWQMSEAVSKMEDDIRTTKGEGREGIRKSEVYEQIQKRDKLTADPTEINNLVRKGVAFGQFMMLASPSYWMVNSTQPYMVSLPYMAARYGYGQSIAALAAAQKMIIHPLVGQAWKTKGGLAAFWSKTMTEEAFSVVDEVKRRIKDPELLAMLDALRRESILDLSWIAELRDIAEGKDTGWMQRTLDASRIMSHLTEVNNRILTAIAAYNLARAKGTVEEATEYAKEVVGGTHFDYSSGSKPLLFRPDGPLGSVAPLVFQFMQWPQHMYAMLISNFVKVMRKSGVERVEAAKILGGLLGTHMLAGGIIGASIQPIKWAIGLAMMALGDDDEPYTFTSAMNGATFDRMVQEGIANVAGPSVAEAVARGVPAALGSDMSSRMSLGTLYFLDLRPETAESTLGSLVMSMGGPWLTIGQNGIRAAADIYNGNITRGIERTAPKAVRDMFKTYRYAKEGLVNNAGDTVIDGNGVPPMELFLQALGFSSNTVSTFYNRQSAIKDTERYGADRREALIAQFVKANDPEAKAKALKNITDFNVAFPAARVTRSTLIRAIRGQLEREASYQHHGANLRGKAQAYADEGWYYQ